MLRSKSKKPSLVIPAKVGIPFVEVSAIEQGDVRAKLEYDDWFYLLLF
jgi:hypothetical protein